MVCLLGLLQGSERVFATEPAPGPPSLSSSDKHPPPVATDIFHGMQIDYDDGRHYVGRIQQNRPAGIGTMHYASGWRYSGFWQQGIRNGQGTLLMPDTAGVYIGNFVAGERTGFGRLVSRHSDYSGHWYQNNPQGYGVFWFDEGNGFYVGYWNQGARWGQGFSVDQNNYYSGNWENDLPNGSGESISATGDWFQGSWSEGKHNGYGRSLDQGGNTYEGIWLDNKKHGFGVETRIDGSRYEGDWYNGQRSGHGIVLHANGDSYEGQWEKGQPEGEGTRYFAGGYSVAGVWRNQVIETGSILLADRPEHLYEGPLRDGTSQGKAAADEGANPKLIDWLRAAAETDSVSAQTLLAQTLTWNEAKAKLHEDEIRYWLELAADKSPVAAFMLARLYLNDADVSQSALHEDAVKLLQNAASLEHAGANLLLGNLYYSGQHVNKNDRLASDYFRAAYEVGSIDAGNNLAWLFATSAEPDLHNGRRALSLIRPIAYNYQLPQYLDTLAAAYAEIDDFDAADAVMRQTLQLMQQQNQQIPQDMHTRLTYYQQKKAWRE